MSLVDSEILNGKDMDKSLATFYLYTTIREELLPLNYYNNMIEAMVMSDIFNWLFKKLDPSMEEILGHIPGTVFQKHFTGLFAEVDENLSLAVLDLLFVFGSGSMRGTFD